MKTLTDWTTEKPEVFWAEINPCEHLIQIYENDEIFINTLQAFVSAGIMKGEVAVIIATSSHLRSLEAGLLMQGIDIEAAREAGLYLPFEAADSLKKFMVYGLPDEKLFNEFVTKIIEDANGRPIRAFGEMAALLWGQGFETATIKLESLWNLLCDSGTFSLFCAYPQKGFLRNPQDSINSICEQHSTVIAGWEGTEKEVLYHTKKSKARD